MPNDLTNFIPEIWSQELSPILDNYGVAMQCVNRKYEGEIKNAGDTVNIRTFGNINIGNYNGVVNWQDLPSPLQQMVVDQKKYFAFKCDDITKAQSNIDIISGYSDRAKVAIALAQDSFILSKHADTDSGNIIGTDASPIAVSNTNIYSQFVALGKALKKSNAVKAGKQANGKLPWVIINPDIEAMVLTAPEFTHASNIADGLLRDGSIGKIAGLDVLLSTNLGKTGNNLYVMAGTDDAITFASQIVEIKATEFENTFDTGIKGLYVYGAKTIVPKALAKLICIF